jgi:glutamate--cysteine ligase catalytic subunit
MSFMMAKAKGEVKSGARLMRDFVLSHPDYKHDSIVSNKIAFDLVKSIEMYQQI